MKKQKNVFLLLGILLIVCSVGLIVFHYGQAKSVQRKTAVITDKIEALLPDTSPGFPGDYTNAMMPVLQIEGNDYAGLLQIPAYGLTMPIADIWDESSVFFCPVRYFGSVYDNTMIVGGSDQPGQFDFFDRMQPGDTVRITDMLGAEFSYTVQRIDRSGSADYEKLSSGDYPLTLFVRSAYSKEYLLVRCVLKTSPETM